MIKDTMNFKTHIPAKPSSCAYDYCRFNKRGICRSPRGNREEVSAVCHLWPIEKISDGVKEL